MKRSLRARFTGIIALLLGLIIVLIIFSNSQWLSDFYLAKKQKTMDYVYQAMNELVPEDDDWTAELQEQLISLSENNNISILAVKGDSVIFVGRDMERERLVSRLNTYVFGEWIGFEEFQKRLEEGQDWNRNAIVADRIKTTDTYESYRAYDIGGNAFYIELCGQLKNNYVFLMRTPLQSIAENVAISNQFFLYTGLIGIVLGAIIMHIATRRLTEPILNLTSLAEKMSRLDFTAKYQGKEVDEIGSLGASMNRMSEQLEKTISELKTANLKLQQDLEQRNRLDEMRSEFISGVSHELKTPIALIQGYAEGLKEGVSQNPEDMTYYCDVIVDESQRMNRLVRELMTLNQIEFGSSSMSMEHFDIAAVIRELLQSYSLLCRQKNIRLIFEAGPTYVWADEMMIEEVIGNYLSNAFHHVSGEMQIEIRLLSRGDTVRLEVFNTGDPIPEESLPLIWDKFYKIDRARSREYGGSGIGLALVKAIMDKHSRLCGVENREDGVNFWIELDGKSN